LIHRTSVPALLSSLIVVTGMWLCNYWVVQQTGGFHQLGLYGAADRYRLLLLFLPSAIAGSALPILSNIRGDGSSIGFRRLLRLNVLVVLMIVSVPALLIALCAGRAMGYFGTSYLAGAPVLSVLCFSAVAESLNTAIGQAVLTDSAWRRFFFDVMLISIVCGTAFLLVPRHGALGLAIAYLAGFACTSAALALYVHSARARSMEVPTCEEFS
jgi:O-antigen/teichoic acid export membrane protein